LIKKYLFVIYDLFFRILNFLQIISHIVLIDAQSYILIQNFTKLLYFGQKNNDTVGTIPKSNIKIDTPNTQIYDHSLSCLGTGTLLKSGGVKLVLWA